MPIQQTRFTQIEYLDDGPATGTPVVLVHGFPDIPATWDETLSLLPSGLRTIRPFLRGVGRSQVTDPEAQSGQVASLATDLGDLLELLHLDSVILVGHDWGARAAHALASLKPELVRGLVTMGTAYGPSSTLTGQDALDEVAAAWYRYWLCTEAGSAAFRNDPTELIRWAWRHWSPSLTLPPPDLISILHAVDTVEFANYVVHYYRHGAGQTEGASLYQPTQAFLDTWPTIAAPTSFLIGVEDGCETLSLGRLNERYFATGRKLVELEGVGHFVPREAPQAIADAIISYLST